MDSKITKKDALLYFFANTVSISLLSDFGIKHTIADDIILDFTDKLANRLSLTKHQINRDKILSSFKNIKPILGVYSVSDINELAQSSVDSKHYITLNNKNINKLISPKNQGLLIINNLHLVKYLFENSMAHEGSNFKEKLLCLYLLHSTIQQVKFTEKHLKTNDGFYISRLGDLELLEKNSKEGVDASINLEDQGYMLVALCALQQTMKNPFFASFFPDNKADEYQSLANDLFQNLVSQENQLIDLETHNLTGIVSCISSCSDTIEDSDSYKHLLLSLSDELYSREVEGGFLLKQKNSNVPASLATHFNGINAFIDSFSSLKYYFLLDGAERIYDNLENLWDNDLGLFKIKNSGRIKYTSKNIAFGLKSLLKLIQHINSLDKKEKILEKLNVLFHSTVKSTGLQRSPESIPSFQSINDFFDSCNGSMVLKGFKLYNRKNKVIIDNKFDSEHALLINDAFFQLYKYIDN